MSQPSDVDPDRSAAASELTAKEENLETSATDGAQPAADDDLDDLEFLLEEIENRIAPLA